MIDAWRVAAAVLDRDHIDEVAAALLDAEREVWARTTTSLRSATTDEVLRSAATAVGRPVDDVLHTSAIEAYLDHWAPTTTARDDARATLHAVRGLGLRTGLLSNTHWPRSRHEEWLVRDGLLHLLDARVYTSELAHVKPHPAAFDAVLHAVGAVPQRAVFVGDRLHDDVSGAASLGMRTIWVRNDVVPRADVAPDAVVDELSEIVPVIVGWLREEPVQ